MPRFPGDFSRNDDIYDKLEADSNKALHRTEEAPLPPSALCPASNAELSPRKLPPHKPHVDADREQTARSPEDMAAEALLYRRLLSQQ